LNSNTSNPSISISISTFVQVCSDKFEQQGAINGQIITEVKEHKTTIELNAQQTNENTNAIQALIAKTNELEEKVLWLNNQNNENPQIVRSTPKNTVLFVTGWPINNEGKVADPRNLHDMPP